MISKHNFKVLKGPVLLVILASLTACDSNNKVDDQKVSDTSAESMPHDNSLNENKAIPLSVTDQKNHNAPLLNNVSATVYKDANCGCCSEWMKHAEEAGMKTGFEHPENLSKFKDKHGIPQQMRSCHTAITKDGYIFEGHIPAKVIAKFLDQPPNDAIGLAVPGMPVGSPGMEYEGKFMPYEVFQINKDGSYSTFVTIEKSKDQV